MDRGLRRSERVFARVSGSVRRPTLSDKPKDDAGPMGRFARKTWTAAAPYLGALLIVVGTAVVAEILYRSMNTTRLSMVFLGGVLLAAVRFGALPGLFSAVLAFIVYDFYLAEPRFSFRIGAGEDVLVLVTFLAASLMTGGLAGRVRDAGKRAETRAATTSTLYQASRSFSQLWDEEALRRRLVHDVARAARGPAVIGYGQWRISEPADLQAPWDYLREVALRGPPSDPTAVEPANRGWSARLVKRGEPDMGFIAWRAASDTPAEGRLIEVLVDLGAAAIERARLGLANSRMEALARTEELRTALLSSISHDFRTPLAAILASASSLRDLSDRMPARARDDLLLTIQEEADRLNRFVANLLNMTRLESGALVVERSEVDLPELVERIWAASGARVGERRLQTCWEGRAVAISDPILLEQALGNIIENAVRYSPDGSAVSIDGSSCGGWLTLKVCDGGPGIGADEAGKIFEKFYRARSAQNVSGTGLGLSIAKGLLEATGGGVRAGAREDGASGLCMTVVLPSPA